MKGIELGPRGRAAMWSVGMVGATILGGQFADDGSLPLVGDIPIHDSGQATPQDLVDCGVLVGEVPVGEEVSATKAEPCVVTEMVTDSRAVLAPSEEAGSSEGTKEFVILVSPDEFTELTPVRLEKMNQDDNKQRVWGGVIGAGALVALVGGAKRARAKITPFIKDKDRRASIKQKVNGRGGGMLGLNEDKAA